MARGVPCSFRHVITSIQPHTFPHISLQIPNKPTNQNSRRHQFLLLHSSLHTTTTAMANETNLPNSSGYEIIGGGRDSFLPALKTLDRPYKPFPVIGKNRHVETIFASFLRTLPGARLRRECMRTSDNAVVSLDWVAGDDVEMAPEAPILLLLPGLTGGSNDTYVQHLLARARRKNWRVVVFNSRGCGNGPVITPQFYSASFTEDLREVVKHTKSRFRNANLYAAGWSLGANILVRYLGEEAYSCSLAGAVSLCNPFNLVIADEDFHKGFNNVYDKALARSLTRIFMQHALLFEGMKGEYNIPQAAGARSVRDFDEGLTRVAFGFKSVNDYYAKSSSSDSIKDVHIPLLCIQAANDPIAPARAIPREDIKDNRNCLLVVTPKGGHLGWVAGDDAPLGAPWTDTLVMEFLEHLERGDGENGPSCCTADGCKINLHGPSHEDEV